MGDTVVENPLPIGPQPGVKYPLTVEYCGNCSMPLEYCEYYPDIEGCKKWLASNLPDQFEKLNTGEDDGDGDGDEKKRQKRGGKGMKKVKKKEAAVEKMIVLSIAP